MTDRLDLTSLRNALVSFDRSLALVGDHAWIESQSAAVRSTLIAGTIMMDSTVCSEGN